MNCGRNFCRKAGFEIIQIVFDNNDKPTDYLILDAFPFFKKCVDLQAGEFISRKECIFIHDMKSEILECCGEVIKTGENCSFEYRLENAGKWYQLQLFPVGEHGACLVAIHFVDITECKKRELNAAFLEEIGADLSRLKSAVEVMEAVGKKITRHLKATNFIFVEICEKQNEAKVVCVGSAEDETGLPGLHPLSDLADGAVRLAAYDGQIIAVSDNRIDPRVTARRYTSANIQAYIIVPFSCKGVWKYLLCIEDSAPHIWGEDEVSLAKEVASRTFMRLERALTEKMLGEKNQLLRVVIEGTSDAIYVKDLDSRILLANSATERALGLTLAGTEDLATPGDRHGEELARKIVGNDKLVMESNTSQVFEETLSNGRIYLSKKEPWHDPDGNVIGLIGISRDITDQIEKERSVRNHQESIIRLQQEKNEALRKTMDMKDEFLSLISHEFKTPLTVINSAIQMLDAFCRSELSDRAKGYIEKIRQNSNRQLKLVNNLLDVTRMNAGKLKLDMTDADIVSLTSSITESIRIYAEQKRIDLSFVSAIEQKVMGIDVEKYERILLNLLSNAIKYTPEGKSITVSLSQKDAGRKSWACVQVIDKGIGIPADKQLLIFDRFGQVDSSLSRQAEGTGIGLYLARMFVEMLGGEINVESTEGSGSTFSILLPLAKSKTVRNGKSKHEITDNRLSRSASIEFSDIYMN